MKKRELEISQGLAPIIAKNSEILILGSLPSVKSLASQEYYGNPRNHFWSLLAEIYGKTLAANYVAKINFLKEEKIALWDVLAVAQRSGSLDSAIRQAQPNDLSAFLNENPQIKKIIFNGQAAAKYYQKYFSEITVKKEILPSTSPMVGRNVKTYAEKLESWKKALTET